MTEYLIAFNDDWTPDLTDDEIVDITRNVRALVTEMKQAGVLVFTGGLDNDRPVFSVDATSGTPVFTDGPFVETKELLGGIAVIDVPDEAAARHWAGRIATACTWPQEVRVFRPPFQFDPENNTRKVIHR